jgi:threonine/homoserine/homoserine lactone efflux protein
MPSFLAIASFAFLMSVLPGPVNLLTLHSGLRFGVRRTILFVSGATLGFSALLGLIGLGVARLPSDGWIVTTLTWAGAALLVWLAIPLFSATPPGEEDQNVPPNFWQGALLQWLNPKAWGACLAALSLFNLRPGTWDLPLVVLLWTTLCFIGVGLWAPLGATLRPLLYTPRHMRRFGQVTGTLLLMLVAVFLGQWALS